MYQVFLRASILPRYDLPLHDLEVDLRGARRRKASRSIARVSDAARDRVPLACGPPGERGSSSGVLSGVEGHRGSEYTADAQEQDQF